MYAHGEQKNGLEDILKTVKAKEPVQLEDAIGTADLENAIAYTEFKNISLVSAMEVPEA